MKALRCEALGPPEKLVVRDGLPSPEPGAGELKLRVAAVGINFPDSLIIAGTYQFKASPPFAPGGECVGVVTAVGEGVKRFAVGDRVLAFGTHGMLAEEVCVAEFQAVKVSVPMSDADAAGFLITYGTCLYALERRGGLKAGETLAVLGAAGGVGTAAIQLGKAMGARVIACASTDEKLAVCKAQGADVLVNTSTSRLKDALKAATDGNGVDVVLDAVGGAQTEDAVRALAWRGRMLVIGFASGTIPSIPLNLTLLKGCSVTGVFWGAYTAREPDAFHADVAKLFALYADGKLKPVLGGTYPLARGGEAIRALMDRKATGKLIVTVA